MTLLPIVVRELRVTARRRSTYFFRLGAAALGLVVLLWIMLLPDFRSPQILGKALFGGLATVSFCYALLIGVFTTADSVSEEKREGTLGLLFLTDLKGYDIVLGKLAATSMNAIYGLLALFPVLAIPLLAGGVSGSEVWRVILAVLNGIFISLALGMLISALSRDERVAMGLTLGVIVFLTGGLPFIGALLNDWPRRSMMHPVFYLFSPAFSCISAFDSTYRGFRTGPFPPYYCSLLAVNVVAWGCLVLACVVIARVWQDKIARSGNGSRSERWQHWKFGKSESRVASRRLWLGQNPFAWLAGRDQMKTTLLWAFLGLAGIAWFWGLSVYKRHWTSIPIYVATGLIVQTTIKLWLASEACRQLGQDKRSGALELLLSTPLPVRKIVQGQLIALVRQFAGPVFVVLAVEFLFLRAERQQSDWILTCVAGMSVFVADLITLAWVGMWLGLRSRSLHRASAAAVVRVLFLPWMVYGVLMTTIFILIESNLGFSSKLSTWVRTVREGRFMLLTWMGICLLNDVAFFVWARHKLLSQFRAVATGQYKTKRSVAEREGRP